MKDKFEIEVRDQHQQGEMSFVGTPLRKIRYIEPKENQPHNEAVTEAKSALHHYFNIIKALSVLGLRKTEVDSESEEAYVEIDQTIDILLQQKLNLEKGYPVVELVNLMECDESKPRGTPPAPYIHHTHLNVQ